MVTDAERMKQDKAGLSLELKICRRYDSLGEGFAGGTWQEVRSGKKKRLICHQRM